MMQEDEARSSQMTEECKLQVAHEVLNSQHFLDEFFKVEAKPVASQLSIDVVTSHQLELIHHAPTSAERSTHFKQSLVNSMHPDKMNIFFRILMQMEKQKAQNLQRIHSSHLKKHLEKCSLCSQSKRQIEQTESGDFLETLPQNLKKESTSSTGAETDDQACQSTDGIKHIQENMVRKEDLLMMEARLCDHISQNPRPNSGKDEVTRTFRNPPIQKNYVKLVDEMMAGNLIPYLIQESILSDDDSERIMKAVTNRDKNVLLLNRVDQKGELGLEKLREALDIDHMGHLSSCLKP